MLFFVAKVLVNKYIRKKHRILHVVVVKTPSSALSNCSPFMGSKSSSCSGHICWGPFISIDGPWWISISLPWYWKVSVARCKDSLSWVGLRVAVASEEIREFRKSTTSWAFVGWVISSHVIRAFKSSNVWLPKLCLLSNWLIQTDHVHVTLESSFTGHCSLVCFLEYKR